MSYNVTGTTITLTRGDTFEALVSATTKDGIQYVPCEGDTLYNGPHVKTNPEKIIVNQIIPY